MWILLSTGCYQSFHLAPWGRDPKVHPPVFRKFRPSSNVPEVQTRWELHKTTGLWALPSFPRFIPGLYPLSSEPKMAAGISSLS